MVCDERDRCEREPKEEVEYRHPAAESTGRRGFHRGADGDGPFVRPEIQRLHQLFRVQKERRRSGTGEMLSFLERLLFSSMTYNIGHRSTFCGKFSSGFIYTMNVPSDAMEKLGYGALFDRYKALLERFGGPSEILVSNDTYQFDDYSKYEASMFDEEHKAKVRAEQFPVDCRKAFEMGARLTGR